MIKTNDTKLPVSLKDTSNLRQLIIENPDLPLIIFCGEESWDGEHSYCSASASKGSIQELTLYDDVYNSVWLDKYDDVYNSVWLDKEDYAEKLADDLCDDEEYKDMTDEEYDAMIDQKVNEAEFVKAIVIYVG